MEEPSFSSSQEPARSAASPSPGQDLPQPSVDVGSARAIEPGQAPVSRPRMSELEWAAVYLAAGVLGFMFVVAIALLTGAFTSEFATATSPEIVTVQNLLVRAEAQYAAASSPETLDRASQLLGQMKESRRESRKVWLDLAQLLLLNLLLPVLTAILGYVFGTMNTKSRPQD